MRYMVIEFKEGQTLDQRTIGWRSRRDADHVAEQCNQGQATFGTSWSAWKEGTKAPYTGFGVIEETKNQWGEIHP